MSAAAPTLIVLADDLTGAADCAARARHAGHEATVLLHLALPLPPGVAALSSETRPLQPPAAAARVRAIAAELRSLGAPWYKKIDSTLRGNIAAELAALLDALRLPCAVVCPAFPAQGRGLHHGQLVAHALALHAQHLPSLLEAASLPVAAVGLEHVRAGADALGAVLRDEAGRGARLLVVDALTDADLATIECATAVALPNALRCGSAGLLGAVAARLPAPTPSPKIVSGTPAGPALLVAGSASAAAQRQIAALRGQCQICCVGENASIATDDQDPRLQASASIRVHPRSKNGGDLLLHLPPPPPDTPLDGPAARALAARLAAEAARIVAQSDFGLLVLVGGDTAAATLEVLGVERLEIERELLPGMPLARVRIQGRERAVALKAGNHGHDDALAELLRLARA